jgi:hypothetical protein
MWVEPGEARMGGGPEEPGGARGGPVGEGPQMGQPPGAEVGIPQARGQGQVPHPMAALQRAMHDVVNDPDMPHPLKMQKLQELVAQRALITGQMAEADAQKQAWAGFAPQPITPHELAHFRRFAEAQIPQVQAPRGPVSRAQAAAYQRATQQRAQQVQAQVQQWAQQTYRGRHEESKAKLAQHLATRREQMQQQREEGKEARAAQSQEAIAARQQAHAERLEKMRIDAENRRAEAQAQRDAQKAQAAEQKASREQSTKERQASFHRHLKNVMNDPRWKNEPHYDQMETARKRMEYEEELLKPRAGGNSAADQRKAFEDAVRGAIGSGRGVRPAPPGGRGAAPAGLPLTAPGAVPQGAGGRPRETSPEDAF